MAKKIAPSTETETKSVSYFDRGKSTWVKEKQGGEPDNSVISRLKGELLSAMQMHNLIVLSGCGTSIAVGGPKMSDLWDACQTFFEDEEKKSKSLNNFVEQSRKNIEHLLSLCESFLQCCNNDSDTETTKSFIKHSKNRILDECSKFLILDKDEPKAIDHTHILRFHCEFLKKLTRRRVRDPRVKIFTTNYDLCFEKAASELGFVVLDGFSFTSPRIFDPRYFEYDIVKRTHQRDDKGEYLHGVFHLYKLHGSVNWFLDAAKGLISEIRLLDDDTDDADLACMIYPANGKFQQSYAQPFIENISRFMACLREPNTCLIIIGFGFNDDHLSEPVLAAIRSNPHLKVVVIDIAAEQNFSDTKIENECPYKNKLYDYAKKSDDIVLINASFDQFIDLLPNQQALSPGEKIVEAIREVKK